MANDTDAYSIANDIYRSLRGQPVILTTPAYKRYAAVVTAAHLSRDEPRGPIRLTAELDVVLIEHAVDQADGDATADHIATAVRHDARAVQAGALSAAHTLRIGGRNVLVSVEPSATMRFEGPPVEHTPHPNPGVPTCPQCGHRVDAHGDTTTGDADRGCRWTEPGGPICPCPLTLETARRPNPSADSYGG